MTLDWGGPVTPQPGGYQGYQPKPPIIPPMTVSRPDIPSSLDFANPSGVPSQPAAASIPTMLATPNGESDWLDGIWDWATSDTGLNTILGAASGAYKMYQAGRIADKDDGPSAAELYDKRVAAHNKSINKPMDMGMIKLKR